ncbi:hypothetical protein J2S43_004779 [Catenuloplanes nepalensis]|uniref:Uncharacterized protein n=1 Tax=Catenuloplanes nepalensis TaxID=587533 RepID=A0ABT9MXU3_9ACTN|nr:hypothetical protein [Catenuloplanes nepalensis]MDP9796267.1 hypothetical protein [Catenuloplanes nepalensis]
MVMRRGLPPVAVLATSVLLCAGGGLTLAYGLSGDPMGSLLPPWSLVPYGALYLLLAWAVVRGHGWGRVLLLILCGVGAALAVTRMVQGTVLAGMPWLGWPVIYAALVSTPSARAWFRRAPESAEDAFFDPMRGPREETQNTPPRVRREDATDDEE